MVIFHSYVSLPEGILTFTLWFSVNGNCEICERSVRNLWEIGEKSMRKPIGTGSICSFFRAKQPLIFSSGSPTWASLKLFKTLWATWARARLQVLYWNDVVQWYPHFWRWLWTVCIIISKTFKMVSLEFEKRLISMMRKMSGAESCY